MKLSDYEYRFCIFPTEGASEWKPRHYSLTADNWREKVFYSNGKARKGISKIFIYRGNMNKDNWREYIAFYILRNGRWKFYRSPEDGEGKTIKAPFKTFKVIKKHIHFSRKLEEDSTIFW